MKILNRYTPLQIAIHVYAWSAIVWIIIELLTGTFSINPIQELEQRTGRHAITLLVLSLLCTPLNTLFGWKEVLKRRRTLGLYSLLYATIHVLIFVHLDYGLAWSLIARTVFDKPYIIVGAITFFMLIPLGVTSFDIWKIRLGKNWKRLHQTVYLIAPLAVLHYAWSKKRRYLRPLWRHRPPLDLWDCPRDFSADADSRRAEISRFTPDPQPVSHPQKESTAESGCILTGWTRLST